MKLDVRAQLRLTRLLPLKLLAAGAFALVVVFAASGPPRPAHAAFHLAVIDEVMFGVNGDPNAQYVEIKMLFAGQNVTAHAIVGAFNTNGTYFGDLLEIPTNVPSGTANGRYILATSQFVAASPGITPDFIFTAAALPAAGMICFGGGGGVFPANPPIWSRTTMLNWADCVPYGGYVGPPIKFGPATPLGLGDGTLSLTRLTDTDNAAADFPSLSCPSPQSNTGAVGLNHDNHIDLPATYPFDDLTWPSSDTVGDNCGDTDDDNDGLTDTVEAGDGPGGPEHASCPTATANTSPILRDSDGDEVLDGAECALGSDPMNVSSKPAFPSAANDPDGDRLSTAFETSIGTNPSVADTDGDGFRDGLEYKNYNSNPLSMDGDGDGCGDAIEVLTVDGNKVVNSNDLATVASQFNLPIPPNTADFDIDKNGVINGNDLAFVASRFNAFC